jgi:hypothetical protein
VSIVMTIKLSQTRVEPVRQTVTAADIINDLFKSVYHLNLEKLSLVVMGQMYLVGLIEGW